jgi:serine phosphatase RsbU (regulator of sigma subunit)
VVITAPVDIAEQGEVLLVEDDEGDAVLVEALLEQAGSGFTPVRAVCLADARFVVSADTSCVLLDLGLPDTTGLDGLQELLTDHPHLPVIVLTGLADRALGEAAVAAGAQDFLVKGSVDGDGLARAIRYAIERKRGQDTAQQLREAELLRRENARLERGLLPRPMLRNPSLRWAARYQPGGRRALLGGDFFDAIERPDGSIRLIVADVAGHGPDEAALGVALRVAWRTLVLAGASPDDGLRHLQAVLEAERPVDHVFATACDVTVAPDLRHAELRVAGHPAPLLIRGSLVEEVDVAERGPILGLTDLSSWPVQHVELGDDWKLLVFTDGIIEGRTPDGGRLDSDGFVRLALEAVLTADDLGVFADELVTAAEHANGGPLRDDLALFLLAHTAAS